MQNKKHKLYALNCMYENKSHKGNSFMPYIVVGVNKNTA